MCVLWYHSHILPWGVLFWSDKSNIHIISMSRFTNYLKDTKVEMRHVSWPTQKQAIVFTILVVVFSIAVALVLGFADFIFSRGLNLIINR